MRHVPVWVGVLLTLVLGACDQPGDGMSGDHFPPTFKAPVARIDLTDDLWDGHAISYGGFRAGQRPGGVYPSDAEILADLRLLEKNWSLIRFYDSDAHGDAVLRLIAEHDIDLKVLLGIYIFRTRDLDGEALAANEALNQQRIAEGLRLAEAYPEHIAGINVGNEVLVSWSFVPNEVATIIGYIRQVAQGLADVGLDIPLTVADNYAFWESAAAHELAAELDFITVHGYAMWDGFGIADGVTFLADHVAAIKANLPHLPVIVGETGWATYAEDAQIYDQIGAEGNEVNGKIYFEQITAWAETTGITTFLFEAFDEPWKSEGNDGAAEGHWGVFDANRRPKLVMREYYPELVTETPTSPNYDDFAYTPAIQVTSAFRTSTATELAIETTVRAQQSCTVGLSDEAYNGSQALLFTHDGAARGGFFSLFEPPLAVTGKTNIVFALSGVPAAAAYFELRIESDTGGQVRNILSYEPVRDGDWNIYTIPLPDFAGVNFAQTRAMGFWHPFSNSTYAENQGHYVAAQILIDDIHFE